LNINFPLLSFRLIVPGISNKAPGPIPNAVGVTGRAGSPLSPFSYPVFP
jgi:hypothetical protein